MAQSCCERVKGRLTETAYQGYLQLRKYLFLQVYLLISPQPGKPGLL